MSVIEKIKNSITGGSARSAMIKKNIIAMFLIKGGSILTSLLLVPITLNYVDSETYGIWLALSSMVTWIHYFDIGINNGLKNQLTAALARQDFTIAKKYISTAYALLSLIFIPVMVLLLIIVPYLNWGAILNLSQESAEGLAVVVSIIVAYFCLNFILSTINIVLQSDQRPADASFRQLIQQILSLVIIYILTLTTEGNLLYLCIALCISPLLIVTIFNISLFSGRYKAISPSIKTVDFSLSNDLLKLGMMFFICQIAFMFRTQMASFLIIRYYGAEDVTSYNIASRYFGIAYMVWGIMMTPIWAAVTDAVAKNEFSWIRSMTKRFSKMLIYACIALFLMLAISSFAYKIWIGDKVSIPFLLSFWVMVFEIVKMVGSLYVQILNGAGILKVQTIASVISPFVFLGSFFLFLELGMGVYSVVIASILSSFNSIILAPIQCKQLLRK